MSNPVDRLNEALSERYSIERKLGEGGMATVYLAEDLRHARKVAIKVLKPELAAVVGGERFLAEIETTANLQHPSILPLFDSGEADGFLFYVMPYIEDESLRDRLNRERQLSVDEAIRIAGDVAEALQAAHERGVIHRDIKPANILLSGGRPLVADFGIALAVSNAGGGRLTETGLSMGTPYYMSPEQAAADRDPSPASDQYSLACVLYEMLVGDPPFPGTSAQAVLARILTGEPEPPSNARKSVPPHIDAVVMRGLEKLPADRFPDAREMARALRSETYRYDTGPSRGASAMRSSLLPWGMTAVFALAAAAAWLSPDATTAPVEPLRVAIPLEDTPIPLGQLLRLGLDGMPFDVSPDGRTLVHMGWDGTDFRLYRRSLDRYESEALPGTEGGYDPFLSLDGQWVAYFSDGGLWKVPIAGGEPQRLANAPNPTGGLWRADGRIWFGDMEGNRLSSVPEEGGTPREEFREEGFAFPEHLPDGSGVVSSAANRVWMSIWTPETGLTYSVPHARRPYVLETGHVTFVRGRTLYAARFDLETLELTTTPVPVLEGIRAGGWTAGYRISESGDLFFVPGANADVVVPVLVDGDGVADTLALPPAAYGHLAISPDLGRIATYVTANENEVSVFDLGSGRAQLIDRAPEVHQSIWSRAGDRIAYGRRASADGLWELIVRDPTSTDETVLYTSQAFLFPNDWSPDDSELLFTTSSESAGMQVYRLSLAGDAESELLLGSDANEWGAVLSPNGRWLAYTSDRTGAYEIYVTSYPPREGEGAVKISTQPGSEEAHWSPEGDAILYRNGGRWWRVPVRFAPAPVPGAPELVAEGGFVNVAGKSWDLLPDGRLLVGDGPREVSVDRIHMIPNFVAEIERRVAESGG
jgi:serine/threonine-protein kinase